MKGVRWPLLLGWLVLMVAPQSVRADCCVCINCPGGVRCFPGVSTTVCDGEFCELNGCPNSQVQAVTGDCSNSLFCPTNTPTATPTHTPATTPTPAQASVPALSPLAAAGALLV